MCLLLDINHHQNTIVCHHLGAIGDEYGNNLCAKSVSERFFIFFKCLRAGKIDTIAKTLRCLHDDKTPTLVIAHSIF